MKIISIIVPVYNAEKLIERCINSILHQTFTLWELILIDDGSKDNSLAICSKYAKIDQRISVFHQENAGANMARLNGIRKSKGKYLFFLDADDYLPHNSLSVLFSEIEKGYDFVRGNLSIVDDYGMCAKQENYKIHKGEFHKQFVYTEFLLTNAIAPYLCGAIYKSDFFSETDFLESINLDIKIGEDYLTLMHASVRCMHFKVLEQTVYFYYHNQNSAMNDKVWSGKTSRKIDTSIAKLLLNNNTDEQLLSLAKEKAIRGMVKRKFVPELNFSWTEYKSIRNYMKSNEGYQKIVTSLDCKYTRFIRYPILYFIYSRIFCILFFIKKRKLKRRKIV